MTIRGNDSPGHAVKSVRQLAYWCSERLCTCGIPDRPQVEHAAVGLRHSDLAQVCDDRFTENQEQRFWRSGKAGVSGRGGPNQLGMQQSAQRRSRDERSAGRTEKKGRPDEATAAKVRIHASNIAQPVAELIPNTNQWKACVSK